MTLNKNISNCKCSKCGKPALLCQPSNRWECKECREKEGDE